MNPNVLFRERQRFRQWWLWAMLILINVFVLIVLWTQCDSDTPYYVPVLVSLPSLVLLLLFLIVRLDTEIRTDGIRVRLYPFQVRYRYYPWESISRIFIRQYRPFKEYGGWGIRGPVRNRALNIDGDQGLQLVLAKGDKLLIGTQQPDKLAAVIATLPPGSIQPSNT